MSSPQVVHEPSDFSALTELRQQLTQVQHQLSAKTEELAAAQAKVQQLERSLAERETQCYAAEAKLGHILNNPIVAINHVRISADRQIETVYLSAGYETLSGYTVQELQPNPDLWLSRIHPEDMQQVIVPAFEKIFAGQTYTLDYRFYRKDGSLCWISAVYNSVWDEATGCWQVTGFSLDNTDRKQLEQAFRSSEAKLSDILDNAIVSITSFRIFDDHTTQYDYCSAGCELLFGYTAQEFLADHNLWLARMHPDDRFLAVQFWQQFHVGKITRREYRFFHKDGSMRWIASAITSRRDEANTCWVFTVVDMDITDHKRTEQELNKLNQELEQQVQDRTIKLAERNTELEAMFQAFPDLLFKIAADGTHLDYKSQEMYSLYCPPEEFMGRRIQDVLPAPAGLQLFVGVQDCLRSNTMVHLEYTLPINGKEEYFEARMIPYRPDQVLQIVRNVSKRKQAEAKIRASLQEKEVLLKEVHHRVKNNMQVISSLLRMQARRSNDEQTIASLQEAQHRIQSIALLHEHLYQSPDFSQIDVNHYVRSLTHTLIQSYEANRGQIRVTIDINDIKLNLTTAIPCSLIINELVSNALKHAFPGGQTGEIFITLRHESTSPPTKSSPIMQPSTDSGDAPHQGVLIIRDNGVGMPKHLCAQTSTSLGLQIVHSLVQQLHGKLVLDCDQGTSVQITFPL